MFSAYFPCFCSYIYLHLIVAIFYWNANILYTNTVFFMGVYFRHLFISIAFQKMEYREKTTQGGRRGGR